MNSDESAAQSIIDAAMQALKNGDRRAARHLAEQAAAQAPHIEQPWLLLAYLASPKAALYYLDRALEANPTSQRALAGKAWLNKQLLESTPQTGTAMPGMLPPVEVTRPTPTAPALQIEAASPGIFPPVEDTRPTPISSAAPVVQLESVSTGMLLPVEDTRPTPAAPAVQAASPARRRLRFAAWLVGIVVLVGLLGGIAVMTNASRQTASQDAALARIVETVLNAAPTLTSTLTSTTVPSATSTTAPTLTATPLPTSTQTAPPTLTSTSSPTSTPTAKPTATPLPSPTQVKSTTYSVVPGDTLNLIALRYNVSVQTLIKANNLANPSLIKAGQLLNIPSAGSPPPASQPTAVSVPAGPSSSGKEIHIDISEQHLYAYQNGELVYSLVVSTGIGNSTRIGTFKVLDKIPNAWSNAFNIWMPYWMGIYYSGTLENGIHGLPLLTNGVELWGNLLGRPATYGCIESRTPDIKKLYNWAEIGTPVIIRR